MPDDSLQPDLFSNQDPRRFALAESWIDEFPQAFSVAEADNYLSVLQSGVDWQAATIRIAGRTLPIPRLQCWMGDPGLDYTYSGLALNPAPWTDPVLTIKSRVEALSGHLFNAVLLNLYRNGADSVAWHADDEPELGINPVVASVSFGASRPFELRHRTNKQLDKVRILLRHGSLLVMGNTLQNNWLHQLPKVPSLVEPRINLTFRRIMG